jgi:hypothetical protein
LQYYIAIENEPEESFQNLEPQEKNKIYSMIAARVAAQQSLGGALYLPHPHLVGL